MQVTINHSGFNVMRLQNNTKFFKEERYKRLQEFPKKNIKICTIDPVRIKLNGTDKNL